MAATQLPLDVVCLHAIAVRLFPDLPRRNIRALAGYLGHSPQLVRRTAGHVEATAFIWQALLPLLEPLSVRTWSALKAWLDEPAPRARRARLVYPLALDRRRALPDGPGVYRFLRRSGDVLYVGKAASLRKRVAGHFTGRGAAGERGLELLTQVHDVDVTETASQLEAALLETDEIKRLDPPYNVQLRAAGRQAWYASSDLRDATPARDAVHRIGPLPSRARAASPRGADGAGRWGGPVARAVGRRAGRTRRVRAAAVAVRRRVSGIRVGPPGRRRADGRGATGPGVARVVAAARAGGARRRRRRAAGPGRLGPGARPPPSGAHLAADRPPRPAHALPVPARGRDRRLPRARHARGACAGDQPPARSASGTTSTGS